MRAVLIADRVTSLGFRLAGVSVVVAKTPEETVALFSEAVSSSDLVLMTDPLARQLAPGELRKAIQNASPPVQVLPVITQAPATPAVRQLVLRSLGVAV